MFHPGEAPGPRRLFRDSVLLQVNTMYHCTLGSYFTCESIIKAYEGDYKTAFYLVGKARDEFVTANEDMRAREHGKWHEFYANDCQADIKQSAWVLEGLMSHLRNLGDGPHFYLWQAEFLCAEEDRRILLLLNTDNHLKDLELYALMKEKWDR